MSSDQTKENTRGPALPISLDFGGPLGRSASDQTPQPPRRPQSQPSLPEPPGDPFKNRPPAYPSLF